jgi:hypothetical protein
MAIHGGCLCGGVRYEINGALRNSGHCHCSMCRRQHGAAFGTYAEFNPGEFRWVSGEDLLSVHESSPGAGWYFCRACGSSLAATDSGELNTVMLGTVEGDPGVRPGEHIFVGSKAPWHEIIDSLPRFEEWPPDR